jgi:hypothetical protein
MVQIKNLSQSETLLVDPFEKPYRLFHSGQPYCIVKNVIIVLIDKLNQVSYLRRTPLTGLVNHFQLTQDHK